MTDARDQEAPLGDLDDVAQQYVGRYRDDRPLDADADDDQVDSAEADRIAAEEGTIGEDPDLSTG